jgi:molybdopterin molybdotransferase
MKSVQEALDAMMPSFVPVGVERLALGEALGRHIGEDVVARRSLPDFDNSSMDGYALRSADTRGASAGSPATLVVAGESRAGGPPPPRLSGGAAIRIFTGAPMPDGADAIVIQEEARVDGARVSIPEPVEPGAWVRERGSDLAEGAPLLTRGARLGPGEIGILAAQGVASVTVFRRPRVAILSTGDELRDLGDPERAGAIVNSNAYALAAQVREAGADPIVLPNVIDDMAATVAALRVGLSADLLMTCGGVSVGDHDLVKQAFAEVGIEAGFWKVRIKPGKPLTFGCRGRVPVVGLPGNPMSAMVTFEALVRPGIRIMTGDARPYRARHHAILAVDHRHATGRMELARATIAVEEGRLVATPLRLQGSGSLPSWVGIDGLLLLDEDRAEFSSGESVPAILVRDETGSARSPFIDALGRS